METNRSRMDDMVERYGEVCTQKVAGQILNVVSPNHPPHDGGGPLAQGRLAHGREFHLRIYRKLQTGGLRSKGKEDPFAHGAEPERFPRGGAPGKMGKKAIRRKQRGKKDDNLLCQSFHSLWTILSYHMWNNVSIH